MFGRVKKISVETKSDNAYAEITGYGRFGYKVRVVNPGDYPYGVYIRYFWFGKARAERAAKKKVTKVQREIDHSKYKKTVTVTN